MLCVRLESNMYTTTTTTKVVESFFFQQQQQQRTRGDANLLKFDNSSEFPGNWKILEWILIKYWKVVRSLMMLIVM